MNSDGKGNWHRYYHTELIMKHGKIHVALMHHCESAPLVPSGWKPVLPASVKYMSWHHTCSVNCLKHKLITMNISAAYFQSQVKECRQPAFPSLTQQWQGGCAPHAVCRWVLRTAALDLPVSVTFCACSALSPALPGSLCSRCLQECHSPIQAALLGRGMAGSVSP